MSEEDKAAVRKIALEVIADYRDRGCPEPEPIGPELLQEMMQWLVCEPVPAEYVPMLLEEMELDGKDSRAVRGTPADDFPVVVIGRGATDRPTVFAVELHLFEQHRHVFQDGQRLAHQPLHHLQQQPLRAEGVGSGCRTAARLTVQWR